MTELERRALLGDKKAQRECAEKGIVLPCPKCYGNVKFHIVKTFEYGVEMKYECQNKKCGTSATFIQYFPFDEQLAKESSALSQWNTLPAPPIGRCGDCLFAREKYGKLECINGLSYRNTYNDSEMFCSYFEPRESETNE